MRTYSAGRKVNFRILTTLYIPKHLRDIVCQREMSGQVHEGSDNCRNTLLSCLRPWLQTSKQPCAAKLDRKTKDMKKTDFKSGLKSNNDFRTINRKSDSMVRS